jgi:hypothetical protein
MEYMFLRENNIGKRSKFEFSKEKLNINKGRLYEKIT